MSVTKKNGGVVSQAADDLQSQIDRFVGEGGVHTGDAGIDTPVAVGPPVEEDPTYPVENRCIATSLQAFVSQNVVYYDSNGEIHAAIVTKTDPWNVDSLVDPCLTVDLAVFAPSDHGAPVVIKTSVPYWERGTEETVHANCWRFYYE